MRRGIVILTAALLVFPIMASAARANVPALTFELVRPEVEAPIGSSTTVSLRLANGSDALLDDIHVATTAPDTLSISQTRFPSWLASGAAALVTFEVAPSEESATTSTVEVVLTGSSDGTPVVLTQSLTVAIPTPAALSATITGLGASAPTGDAVDLIVTVTATGDHVVSGLSGELAGISADIVELDFGSTDLRPGDTRTASVSVRRHDFLNMVAHVSVDGVSAGRPVHAEATLTGAAPTPPLTLTASVVGSFSDLVDAAVLVDVGNQSGQAQTIRVRVDPPTTDTDSRGASVRIIPEQFGPEADSGDARPTTTCLVWAPHSTRSLSFRVDADRGGGRDLPLLVSASIVDDCESPESSTPDAYATVDTIVTLASSSAGDTFAGRFGLAIGALVPGALATLIMILCWNQFASPRKIPRVGATLDLKGLAPLAILSAAISLTAGYVYFQIRGVSLVGTFGLRDLLEVMVWTAAVFLTISLVVWNRLSNRYPVLDVDTPATQVLAHLARIPRGRNNPPPGALRPVEPGDPNAGLVVWRFRGSAAITPVIHVTALPTSAPRRADALPGYVSAGDVERILQGVPTAYRVAFSPAATVAPSIIRLDAHKTGATTSVMEYRP